jgi:hypothetical protein
MSKSNVQTSRSTQWITASRLAELHRAAAMRYANDQPGADDIAREFAGHLGTLTVHESEIVEGLQTTLMLSAIRMEHLHRAAIVEYEAALDCVRGNIDDVDWSGMHEVIHSTMNLSASEKRILTAIFQSFEIANFDPS